MLKKVIIGFLCFVILAVTGIGVYIYMLDWNKHKSIVSERFSQITGLKAQIEGDLSVELFPSPKFSAKKVKFSKTNNFKDPLIVVNEISANVDLIPMFSQKFILKSMNLAQATVFVKVEENGNLNWSGVGVNSQNKSGNIEVSFNNVRLSGATFSYKNLQNQKEFSIPNISASVSAPSLKGPYRTDGRFIHNNNEINFKGNIVNDRNLALNMVLENAATASKATLEGTLGSKAKGTITLDTAHLVDCLNTVFGEETIKSIYDNPFYVSFKYDYDKGVASLDNFTVAYGRDTKGTGTVNIKKDQNKKDISASLDMTQFNLNLLENLGKDIYAYAKDNKNFADLGLENISASLNLKSGQASYRETAAKDLNIALTLADSVLKITRFDVDLAGNTNLKAIGQITLNNQFAYQFEQTLKSDDFRVFASIFGIDLTKFASEDNKKSIFKRVEFASKLSGNLANLTLTIPVAIVDSIDLAGNIGFIVNDGKTFVVADVNASKILFDKYLQLVPENMAKSSLQDKIVYQLNLVPWNREYNVDARLKIDSAVYNQIPLEKVLLEFQTVQDNLNIKKLAIENFAGGSLNLSLDASKIYTEPFFNELGFDVRTSNFPQFANMLGIKLGQQPIFKRKIFAAQGALNGNFSDFSLSSIQKFGDTEFSYTGTVAQAQKKPTFEGELELKTDNFSDFVEDIGLNYSPDLPITTFTLSGKFVGSNDNFSVSDISSHLGANAIAGKFDFKNDQEIPSLKAQLIFDRFDADRLFNLNKMPALYTLEDAVHAFIAKPEIDSDKIDYTNLKNINFDVKVNSKQLVYKNNVYTDALIDAKLDKGVLTVDNFVAKNDDLDINLAFVLDSNNIAKIEGKYNVKALKISPLEGKVYAIEGGLLDASGSFNSLAISPKDFFDNLTSCGKFQLLGTAVKGWDLDIIKFELEQRKNADGFEDSVKHNLASGRSIFTKIAGKYDISQGVVIADSTIFESPVANINMKLDLNLTNWLFTAVFNAIYHNASFSDVLKFSFDGDLADPNISVNLEDSIKRISEAEKLIKSAKNKEEKAQQAKLGKKISNLENEVDSVLKNISKLTLEVVRFKPLTDNENVNKIYEANLQTIQDVEDALTTMQESLKNNPSEQALMEIETNLGLEKTKLQFVPKSLEDNFIVDSKYVFDDTFNKIAWVYNVAQNNASYYESLSDVYMGQIKLLNKTDKPVSPDKINILSAGIDAVLEEMEGIKDLHSKVRENYLTIIDATNVDEMKENNEIASQALKTLLTYTENLNTKIINSIDEFRAVLDISAKDYEEFMVFPPHDVNDIDITQPTIRTEKAEKSDDAEKATEDKVVEEKKEEVEEQQSEEKSDVEIKTNDEEKAEEVKVEDVKVEDVKVEEENDVSPKSEEDLSLSFSTSSGLSDLLADFSKEEITFEEPLIVASLSHKTPEFPLFEKKNSNLGSQQKNDDVKKDNIALEIDPSLTVFIDDTEDENKAQEEQLLSITEPSFDEDQSSNFSTNPIVAFELENGEPVQTAAIDAITPVHKRRGFRRDVTYVVPSFEEIIISENKKDEMFPKIVDNKPLVNLLSAEKSYLPAAQKMLSATDTPPTIIEEQAIYNAPMARKYLFNITTASSDGISGVVEKMMSLRQEKPVVEEISQQYLFMANMGEYTFSGEVGKNMFLRVK